MSSLIPFSFESREVRFIPNGDSFSVIAKDVFLALEYAETTLGSISQKIAHVPEEWRGIHRMSTLGGSQEMLTLTEQGLYFFVNRSDKPKALPLQKWVAGEVLPSIRKTGSYSLPGASSSNPVLAAQLAELLQGKVLVDFETLSQLTRIVYALEVFLPRIVQLAKDLERQCGRPLVADLEPVKAAPAACSSRRAVVDPWQALIADWLAGRNEVTQAEIFAQCLNEPQTLPAKNRVARILKQMGFVCELRRQGSRVLRVYVRVAA